MRALDIVDVLRMHKPLYFDMEKKLTNQQLSDRNRKIQDKSALLLRQTISDLIFDDPDLGIRIRSEEDQNDKGVDFEIELEGGGRSFLLFKIQNKGILKLNPLKKEKTKALFSYQIDIKNLRHYRYDIPVALVFTVCDITNKKVYWHSVQLDDELDERMLAAEQSSKRSIQLYIKLSKTEVIGPPVTEHTGPVKTVILGQKEEHVSA
ncbi:DUF4365 domain-containing protein [Chitinophaga filiformis]|uniref:DUF4365 domain-containing protein n=1 Tax=Chitinophaga filiformis TaxID=104663 RepID=A0ABY4HZ98_CHIFI|nr:DUF4365 domain-containing protein [Chitinophaga filiformis]UPK68730.1 DUF4365 domain-containing protein [Chitinophaga filiformis]